MGGWRRLREREPGAAGLRGVRGVSIVLKDSSIEYDGIVYIYIARGEVWGGWRRLAREPGARRGWGVGYLDFLVSILYIIVSILLYRIYSYVPGGCEGWVEEAARAGT